VDLEYIESLAELVRATAVAEVTVRRGERSVTVRRAGGPSPALPTGATVAAAADTFDSPPSANTNIVAWGQRPAGLAPLAAPGALVAAGEAAEAATELVRAHRVGFFRRAKAAGGEALVGVGDWAAAGQQVASIESMKLYDEVESPLAGRIIGIFPQDGAPVQYGQPLFHVELCDAPEPTGEPPAGGAAEVAP
jgi:acetyl-CoA carboxylase biotin carboxyl carrier protein